MYKIIDLLFNLVIGNYYSPLEVLDVWAAKCSRVFGTLDFDQLNVTGKETYEKSAWKYRPGSIDPSYWVRSYTEVPKLKRFQVVCGDNPVDIRLWTQAIEQYETLRFRAPFKEYLEARTLLPWISLLEEPVKTGKKVAMRRDKEPAMYRQTRILASVPLDEDMPQLRHPNRGGKRTARSTVWKNGGFTSSRSWKDQSRSCCQWGDGRLRKKNLRDKQAINEAIRKQEEEYLHALQALLHDDSWLFDGALDTRLAQAS